LNPTPPKYLKRDLTYSTIERLKTKFGYDFYLSDEEPSKVLKNMQEEFEDKVAKYLGNS
jgi:hypothetical protein